MSTPAAKVAQAQTRRVLEANRTLLEDGARQLLARETLADAELQDLLLRVKRAVPSPPHVGVGAR